MNAEEQLEKIKTQNRIRQANFYAKNKEVINQRRREIYKAGREKLQPQEEEEEEEEERPSGTTFGRPELVAKQRSRYRDVEEHVQTNFSKKRVVTYQEAVKALNSLEINQSTKAKYLQDLKRLMNLTDCNDNIIKCFRDYEKIIDAVNTSKKQNDEPYSINTKKSLFQMVLYLIDKLHLPITKKIKNQYKKQFDISKIASSDENVEKQENTTIISFSDYLQKVGKEFGVNSKQFVLSCLYREITLRDDFILKIVASTSHTRLVPEGRTKNADSIDDNYIVVPKKDSLTIIINNYKTSDKYGQIKAKLSINLSKLIRNFIKVEKLKYDDYLFGSKNLTQFVTKMNKKIGISGGINNYRKMSVSDLLRNNPSPQERAELSASMAHSPIVQTRYLRKIV